MKIISYNINGIRAAIRKNFMEWLTAANPDIICLQEIKATPEQVDFQIFKQAGFHYITWNPAKKKGYSGTAILSKIPPKNEQTIFNYSVADDEGRIIVNEYENFVLVNAYFPSGAAKPERQQIKLNFLGFYSHLIAQVKKTYQKPIILCGDFNICHTEKDIHDPIRLNGVPGFTPTERNWISDLMKNGFSDGFRLFNPQPHNYTWWSYMARARERNAGWRIDYFFIDNQLISNIKSCNHLIKAHHSDHCPVLLIIK